MIAARAAVHLSLVMNSKGVVLHFNEEWYMESAFSKAVVFFFCVCVQVYQHCDIVVLILIKCFLKQT